jgi:hypothetical protein
MTPTKDSRRDSAQQSSKADLFCSNAKCELHRRAGASGVMGSGNWAILGDGRIIGRGLNVQKSNRLSSGCGPMVVAEYSAEALSALNRMMG